MGDRSIEQPISLPELDARHDDLLDQLEELDQRIQTVLKEHLPQKAAPCTVPSSEDSPLPPSRRHSKPLLSLPTVQVPRLVDCTP